MPTKQSPCWLVDRYTRWLRPQAAFTLIELLAVLVVISLAVALFLPLTRSAREPARRNSCLNSLKQIALAIRAYENAHGALPPTYTVDEQGDRLHSWRTLILPYMEGGALAKSIDLTKPWNAPANANALEKDVENFQCPSSPEALGRANYLAVVGPDGVFWGPEPRRLSDVKDGLKNTISIVDANKNHTAPWMAPEDIRFERVIELVPDAKMHHPGLILAAYLDGHAIALGQDIEPGILRGMLTIAGGEKIEP